MFINNNCRYTDKISLIIDLIRYDENLATLIELEYDYNIEIQKTMKTLEYIGISFENKKGDNIFNEFSNIINGLIYELKNNDSIIHKNKKYGIE